MMTRKELLNSLLAKGVEIHNTEFENEDLVRLDAEVEDILEIGSGCTCGCCDDIKNTEDEEVDISDDDLIGYDDGETEVVHVVYPAEDNYPLIQKWIERINDEYENVEMKFSIKLDAFIFFCGEFEDAERISEELIDDIENE